MQPVERRHGVLIVTPVCKHQAGFALLGLLGTMLVLALLAAALLTLFNTQLLQTTESSLSAEAFQAGETGVSLGKASISTNLFWYADAPYTITGTIGRAFFSTVVTTNTTGMARIASTGRRDPTEWTSIWEDTGENYIGVGGKGKLVQALIVYRDTSTPAANRNIPRWRA